VGILIGEQVITNDASVFHLRLFFRLSAFCIEVEVFLFRSLKQRANVSVSLYVSDFALTKLVNFVLKHVPNKLRPCGF
jgi:hypothetical protein